VVYRFLGFVFLFVGGRFSVGRLAISRLAIGRFVAGGGGSRSASGRGLILIERRNV
jgi:hypothetical protein